MATSAEALETKTLDNVRYFCDREVGSGRLCLETFPDEGVADEVAFFADSLSRDELVKKRAAKFMSNIVLSSEVSTEYVESEEASLVSVVKDYFSEDVEARNNARRRLTTDFRTNVFEILCASGHVSQVEAEYQKDSFWQYGYSLRAMYAHGALHAKQEKEKVRRDAESLNEFRIEDGYRAGLFKTHYFVELSRAPDDMDETDAKSNGYHTGIWKGKLRCTEVDNKGSRLTAEAAVAGSALGGRDRYDVDGIRAILAEFNLDSTKIGATEALKNGFWVPKSRLQYGVASLAELYDRGLNESSFFGVLGQMGDYSAVTNMSAARETKVEDGIDEQVELLAEQLNCAKTCDEALRIMGVAAKDFAAEVCSSDAGYDSRQFGVAGSGHLEASRYYASCGNQKMYEQELRIAKQTATVYMCGDMIVGMINERGEFVDEDGNKIEAKNNEKEGNCEYISKQCPLCKGKNVKTKETAKSITCGKCNGSVMKKKAV